MHEGKGAMVWKLRGWAGGDPARQVAMAQNLGLAWVSIKTQDGSLRFWENPSNYPGNQNWHLMAPSVRALVAAGIRVNGWGWLYGRSTDAETANLDRDIALLEAQATLDIAADMVALGADNDFWEDAEGSYKEVPPERVGMATLADKYLDRLELTPALETALCSYRFPTQHGTFPFGQFAKRCDYNAPQVYFVEATDPQAGALQLKRCLAEYDAIKALKTVPIGPTYLHAGWWRATSAQLRAFHDAAHADPRCVGVGIWCLDLATAEQLAAWKACTWGPPPPTVEQRLAGLEAWAIPQGYVPLGGAQ